MTLTGLTPLFMLLHGRVVKGRENFGQTQKFKSLLVQPKILAESRIAAGA
jgi:hypothetical protein